ncbi:18707_t:CDS:2 [Funneliformis geosporum]|uniref:18707_t:CDS:1 n=1 Tax=Funneliformis geosporum TaxID=1117311 RepID=A0A9W4WS67_9GLOM|nr:18707_t:CDS:2 [Funneliformis geosporum]
MFIFCYIYYPFEQVISECFQQFWNWITAEYPAVTFTRYTQQYLEELNYTYLYIGTADTVNDALHNLIFSIQYNIRFVESPIIISEIISVPSSITSDDTDSTISSDNFNNYLPNNSLLYTNEDLNLENLFKEMAANQADV